jgi:formate dehydrogenase alpha subunit
VKGEAFMVKLKIDGKEVQIEKGATILAAAEKVGVAIPTLCFLQKVSPTGACRICVVEVAGAEKPMTACNTVAVEGMEITTQSEKLSVIRRQVVELLLVNHPLDCPVCDAGGECDLQNICYAQNVTRQPFAAEDVNPPAIDHWPLIQQVPNRCILCEKCVKVCHEVVGSSALFVNDKGDRAFVDKKLELCEFCGNCVAVCPTGTMISKPFKFKARCWDLTKVASTCTSCGSQCQIDLNVKNGQVYRVTADDATTINNGNLCFNGFFGYDFIHAPQRLQQPLLRRDGITRPATWNEALTAAADGLRRAGSATAGIAGNRLTNEEGFLFQALLRSGLGSNNLDNEARFGMQRVYALLSSQFGMAGGTAGLGRIGTAEAVLVLGADPTAEAPAVDWQIQKAARKGDAKLVVGNARRVKLQRQANVPLLCRPGSEGVLAAALARQILDLGLADQGWLQQMVANVDELRATLANVDVAAAAKTCGVAPELIVEAAQLLGAAKSVAIVIGGDLYRNRVADAALAAVANLALVSGAMAGEAGGIFPIGSGGNTQGLLDMGVACDLLPGGQRNPASGRDLNGILAGIESGEIKSLYLAGVNPLLFAESARWHKALEKVEFLVVQDLLDSELTALAHVVLPGVSFAEKNGTVTSSAHRVSPLAAAIAPLGEARNDAAILADLLARIAPQTRLAPEAVTAEVQRCSVKAAFSPAPGSLRAAAQPPIDVAAAPLLLAGKDLYYAAAVNIVSANARAAVPAGYIGVCPADAQSWGVADGGKMRLATDQGSIEGAAKLDGAIPAGVVFVPFHCPDLNVQQLLPTGTNVVAVKVAKA